MHTKHISLMDIQRVIQLVCWFVYIFEAIYIYLHRFITPLSDQSVQLMYEREVRMGSWA